MAIDRLSTELLQKIYEYATLQAVLNLSMTSKKHRSAYLGRQLPILRKSFYNSPYSPYPELIKLVISGLPDTNRKLVGTEVRRRSIVNHVMSVGKMDNLTLDFIKKMVHYAKVAEKWTEIYPQLRWRYDSDERRILRPHEAERLRCAIYQHWTYSNLFHDQDYCEWDPDLPKPGQHHRNDLRFRLARTWTTIEIIRQSEFVNKMRQLLEIELYPSNAVIQHRYSRTFSPKELAKYGWGDEEEHRRLGDALLKLDPAEMLHLYQNSATKSQRLDYLQAKGRWYHVPASWDCAVLHMAYDERSCGRPHPPFPSSTYVSKPPFVALEDENVEFGITDCCERDGPQYFRTHVYANDASPTGEWIPPHNRLAFRGRLRMENLEDGDDHESGYGP